MTQLDLQPVQNPHTLDPLPLTHPAFYGSEGMVWWWDHATPHPRYHELPVPAGAEYSHLMPLLTYGTPEEAEAMGRTPCPSPGCKERRDRRRRRAAGRKPSAWSTGATVRK